MEQFYGSGSSEALLPKSDTAIIGFAGAFAGGSNNAQYEQMLKTQFGNDNILAVPSVSSKYAFKENILSKKSYRSNEYYRSLATHAIERFPDKKTFLVHSHSGGGIEGLAFAKALLENDKFSAQTLKLLFTGIPGISEKGAGALGRIFDTLKRFADININRAKYQHFDLCPPPEEYYTYEKKQHHFTTMKNRPSTNVVYNDTPDTRKHRREKFYTQYMSFLPEPERKKISGQIAGLDASIKSVLTPTDSHTSQYIKELMHQRAKLIYSVAGDRYYNEYLAKKPEYRNVPSAGFDGAMVTAQYVIRLISSVATGLETHIADIKKLAVKKHKKINVSFGFFEKDKLMSSIDIPTIQHRLAKTDTTDTVTDWLIMEGLSHDSVDNSPQGIFGALNKLNDSLTSV